METPKHARVKNVDEGRRPGGVFAHYSAAGHPSGLNLLKPCQKNECKEWASKFLG